MSRFKLSNDIFSLGLSFGVRLKSYKSVRFFLFNKANYSEMRCLNVENLVKAFLSVVLHKKDVKPNNLSINF